MQLSLGSIWLAIAVTNIGVHFAFILAFPLLALACGGIGVDPTWLIWAYLGLLGGQAILAAVWTVVGEGWVLARVPIGVLLVGLVAWTEERFFIHAREVGSIYAVTWALACVLFVALRCRGYRLLPSLTLSLMHPFTTGHLALWMTVAAVALALGRWATLLPLQPVTPNPDIVIGVIYALVGAAAAWASLAGPGNLSLTGLCLTMAFAMPGLFWVSRRVDVSTMIPITEATVVFGSLCVVRIAGYQLQRQVKADSRLTSRQASAPACG